MRLPTRILFIAHGVVTAAAGVVLVAAPGLIPSAVDIALTSDQYLLPYLLAGAEFGLAALSFGALRMRENAAIRLIALVFVITHAITAVVELLALAQGAAPALWPNVALRALVTALFLAVFLHHKRQGPTEGLDRVAGSGGRSAKRRAG
jgi:hypothetical protein